MKQFTRNPAGLLLLAALATLFGCSEKPLSKNESSLPTVKAQVERMETVAVPFLIEVPGTLQALEAAQIAARVSGQITEVPVSAGSRVKKGELLVKISAAEIAAHTQRAETQLTQARRNLEREEKLLSAGASTRESVKSLREMVQISEAARNEARAMLNDTSLRAPFAGLVTHKFIEVGDLATPGKPLLQLETGAQLQVVVPVPEALVKNLLVGDSLQISIPAAELKLNAAIIEIAPTVDPATRTTRVKLSLPDHPALRSGQFARVSLPDNEVKTLLIAASALHRNGQIEQVFVEDKGVARLRLVRTGARYGDRVEILSGLEAGEMLVLASAAKLADGQPLQIVEGEL
jgi:RND family efflux transporter MFP subunit